MLIIMGLKQVRDGFETTVGEGGFCNCTFIFYVKLVSQLASV